MTARRRFAALRVCRIAAALGCLVAFAATPGRGAGEPGPVPLLRDVDAAVPEAVVPRAAPAAGLGDWRLVAALAATFAVLVGARLATTRRAQPLPPDVFEVLGTATLGGQHAVRIVRFGPKTLLVGVSATGATTLAEIADAQATACIAAACRSGQRPARDPGRADPRGVRGPAAKEAA